MHPQSQQQTLPLYVLITHYVIRSTLEESGEKGIIACKGGLFSKFLLLLHQFEHPDSSCFIKCPVAWKLRVLKHSENSRLNTSFNTKLHHELVFISPCIKVTRPRYVQKLIFSH